MAAPLSATTPYGVASANVKAHIHLSYDLVCSKPSLNLHHCPKFQLTHFPQAKFSLKCNLRVQTPPSAISGAPGAESSAGTEDTTYSLDNAQVVDLNGNGIPISDLWKDRKAVVAFARHFGCVLCRKRADYLAAEKDKMDAAGVALVLIGPGSVDQAKKFFEQTKFKGEIYADPSYASYKALNFVSGVTTTVTAGAGLKIIEAYVEGYRQDWALSFEKDTRTRGGWTKKQVTTQMYKIS
ncbi:prostamide/prostaglandin F synthase [Striga asiatica]|uniref:Prostamide/prostaglandin F synthase n=1 Tax=Striga asiatica TaxID=4170 RepID=A0A5A7RJI5_STRAF|nr:prostamide/prostaglandin F synthase [Striga asiatica]